MKVCGLVVKISVSQPLGCELLLVHCLSYSGP